MAFTFFGNTVFHQNVLFRYKLLSSSEVIETISETLFRLGLHNNFQKPFQCSFRLEQLLFFLNWDILCAPDLSQLSHCGIYNSSVKTYDYLKWQNKLFTFFSKSVIFNINISSLQTTYYNHNLQCVPIPPSLLSFQTAMIYILQYWLIPHISMNILICYFNIIYHLIHPSPNLMNWIVIEHYNKTKYMTSLRCQYVCAFRNILLATIFIP